jgi:hypothetical protein
MLQHFLQQSAILSVTLTFTFCSLSISESQFSQTWQRKAISWGKGDNRLSYSGTDEIPVSHLMETEKCWKANLIRQSHLTNLHAAENGFLLQHGVV